MQPESRLNEAIKKYVAQEVQEQRIGEGKVLKVHGNQFMEAGTPDLLIGLSINNVTVVMFVESKVGNNKPTAIQERRLKEWGFIMATAAVWDILAFQNFYMDVLRNLERTGVYQGYYGHYKTKGVQ